MNVLVVHPYLSVLGGGERVCVHVVKALLEEGYDVGLIGEPTGFSKLKQIVGVSLEDTPVKLYPYKKFKLKIRKFSVYQRMLHHMFSKLSLGKRVGKPEVEFLTQDVAFMVDAGKRKIAYVHFPEFLAHLETQKPSLKWFWKTYYAPIKKCWKRSVDKVDLFLCNSNFTRKHILERWGKDAVVVYPPVDVEDFKPSQTKKDVVVSIGRFVQTSGHLYTSLLTTQLWPSSG